MRRTRLLCASYSARCQGGRLALRGAVRLLRCTMPRSAQRQLRGTTAAGWAGGAFCLRAAAKTCHRVSLRAGRHSHARTLRQPSLVWLRHCAAFRRPRRAGRAARRYAAAGLAASRAATDLTAGACEPPAGTPAPEQPPLPPSSSRRCTLPTGFFCKHAARFRAASRRARTCCGTSHAWMGGGRQPFASISPSYYAVLCMLTFSTLLPYLLPVHCPLPAFLTCLYALPPCLRFLPLLPLGKGGRLRLPYLRHADWRNGCLLTCCGGGGGEEEGRENLREEEEKHHFSAPRSSRS